jgi:hypothetical protein
VRCGGDFVGHALRTPPGHPAPYLRIPGSSLRDAPRRAIAHRGMTVSDETVPGEMPRSLARAHRTCTLQWHRPRDCMMATLSCHVLIVHGPAFAKWQCKTPVCEVIRRRALLTSQPFTMLRPARRRTSKRSAWNKAQALDGLGARQIWLTNILAQQTSARSQAMEDVPHLAPHRSIA